MFFNCISVFVYWHRELTVSFHSFDKDCDLYILAHYASCIKFNVFVCGGGMLFPTLFVLSISQPKLHGIVILVMD